MPTASFDVFDTLLTRRWAEPRDLFVQLGHRLRAAGLTTLNPTAFARERCVAELRARARVPSGETTLDEIFRQLGAALRWSDPARAAALAAEIDLETEGIRTIRARRVDVERARQQAGRVVFLSDMYLPSAVVSSWLERAGFFQPGDLLLVSGEAGGGKGNGALYEIARARTGGDFRDWLHVGDNPQTDVVQPRRLGIAVRPSTAARLTPREQILRGHDRFAPPWRSLLAGAAREARLAGPDESATDTRRVLWNTGTAVAGPLFFAFTDWCLREAEARGLEDLFFLARGGQIFFRIAQSIQAARPGRVRCHYLFASRLAFVGVADTDNPALLRELIAAPLAFHSARQACANVGLDINAELAPPNLPGDAWDRNLTPAERDVLADRLLSPPFFPLVIAALRERGRRARAYVVQAGLRSGARQGIVDTGWSGTIQRNIELLLAEPGKPARLVGFYLGLLPQKGAKLAGDAFGYITRFAPLPLRRDTTHLILLELMARGSHGAVLGFEVVQGSMVPRLGATQDAMLAEIEFFQSAVLSFVGAQLAAVGGRNDEIVVDDLARTVIGAYRSFFRHPTISEVLCFGRLPHADQMWEQRYSVLCPEMTLAEAWDAITHFHRRPPGWWIHGQRLLGQAPLLSLYQTLKILKWALKSRFA